VTTGDAIWVSAAGLAAATWLRLGWLGLRTLRALPALDRVAPDRAAPSVTAVVPCRNEARDVERAVRSLLAQDLSGLEVVAVDDRSSDDTGAILDRLAAAHPRLAVVHVAALPAGWLGKNHACHAGAARARGAWLLFTDGDVVFAPDALRRALAFARAHGLGHVVALPRFVAPGFLERAFVTAFAAWLSNLFRVFELQRPGTRGFAGVGAFNLVRRDAYDAIGGHRRLALEVADDLKLGLVLRRSGVPQGAVDSAGLVAVRWQHGFVASVLGLVKNAFAGSEYRLAHAAATALVVAFAGAVPPAALLLASHPAARAAGALGAVLSAAIHGGTARRLAAGSGLEGLLQAPCALLIAAVLAASAVAARFRGAVVWRGTRYPLAALRAGCVRADDWPAAAAAGWSTPAREGAAIEPTA